MPDATIDALAELPKHECEDWQRGNRLGLRILCKLGHCVGLLTQKQRSGSVLSDGFATSPASPYDGSTQLSPALLSLVGGAFSARRALCNQICGSVLSSAGLPPFSQAPRGQVQLTTKTEPRFHRRGFFVRLGGPSDTETNGSAWRELAGLLSTLVGKPCASSMDTKLSPALTGGAFFVRLGWAIQHRNQRLGSALAGLPPMLSPFPSVCRSLRARR